jgi:hypothetical protein
MKILRYCLSGGIVSAGLLLAACNSASQQAPSPPSPQVADAPTGSPSGPADSASPAPAPEVPAAGDSSYAPEPQQVISVYEQPAEQEPAPVAVASAPPPMLEEPPPPQPTPDDFWTGGYWAWQGTWVWVSGRWLPPPRPHYHWVQPYYEHRGDRVVFIDGFWGAPDVRMVPPARGVTLVLEPPGSGYQPGPPPEGPEGVFVPPPPGSRFGLIIPAPLGTPPAVVTSAPPVVNVGMRITGTVNQTTVNDTTINNSTTINNVTIYAPATATANHRAVNVAVPAVAHLAAAIAPVVRVPAPRPSEQFAVPSFGGGHTVRLPAATTVRPAFSAPAAERQAQETQNRPAAATTGASEHAMRAAPEAAGSERAAEAQRQSAEAPPRSREAQPNDREEAERKAGEEAQRKAGEEAQRKAGEEAQRKAGEDAQRKAGEAAQAAKNRVAAEHAAQAQREAEETRQHAAAAAREDAAESKQKAEEAKRKAVEAQGRKPPADPQH